MEPEQKQILKQNSTEISKSIRTLESIKPMLIEFRIFNKLMWKDIHTVSDVFDLLPSRGPEAFPKIIEILKRAKYDKEAKSLETPTISIQFSRDMFYRISSNTLGKCLVINNVKFDCLKERLGSDKDAESLQKFFKGIGYNVAVEPDMKAVDMYNRLEQFSKSNFQGVGSSFVIILSHGDQVNNQDVCAGTDAYKTENGILRNVVSKNTIINLFSNENCGQLQGKPKVFFFVACRGNEKDYGAPCLAPSESADNIENVYYDNTETWRQENGPTRCDIFVIHSCLPDYISIRDDDEGSWFCQDLISVLQNHYRDHDLETMIERVNSKLMKRVSNLLRVYQVAHFETFGVWKKLMLCGIPSN